MSKFTLVPKNDKLIAKAYDISPTKVGRIILNDTTKERPLFAEVVAVSNGWTSPFGHGLRPSVKVGDIIVLPAIGTTRVDVNGEEFIICADTQIMSILIKSESE